MAHVAKQIPDKHTPLIESPVVSKACFSPILWLSILRPSVWNLHVLSKTASHSLNPGETFPAYGSGSLTDDLQRSAEQAASALGVLWVLQPAMELRQRRENSVLLLCR